MGRAFRPGRMHDQTAVRTEGIADLFTRHPQVRAKVDAGGPRPGQTVPGRGPGTAAEAEERRRPGRSRRLRGTAPPAVIRRICVEHANAEHKQWRVLQRFLGPRDDFDETYLAVACLVSDRAAER